MRRMSNLFSGTVNTKVKGGDVSPKVLDKIARSLIVRLIHDIQIT